MDFFMTVVAERMNRTASCERSAPRWTGSAWRRFPSRCAHARDGRCDVYLTIWVLPHGQ